MRGSDDFKLSSLKAVAFAVCKRTVPLFLTVLVVVILPISFSGTLMVGLSSLREFERVRQID